MANPNIELDPSVPNIVVAHTDKNYFIGNKGSLPWGRSLKGDLQFINRLIRSKPNVALVMGRTTFLSMPRKKGITSIMLSRTATTLSENTKGCLVFSTLEAAIEHCKANGLVIVIFGGENVYRDALKMKCKIFSTIITEEGTGLRGDRIYVGRHDNMKNITEGVAEFISDLEHDWILKDGKFYENGYEYAFYTC